MHKPLQTNWRFDKAVRNISCQHILDRYEHITEYGDADRLMELDKLARKGDCQFAHNCRYRKPECDKNAPPDKLVFGITRVSPKLMDACYREDPIFKDNL